MTYIQENWVAIGDRGLHGGILITGSIGSGKTQGTILPYLAQLLKNYQARPSLLAIDPKGTFLPVVRKMIDQAKLSEHVINMALEGDVSMNPVFREKMLRDGAFLEIAEMIRAASANFIGRSGESLFWEFSAFTLIKNTVVYCAAKYDYFTLVDFYSALVRATDESLADELDAFSKDSRFSAHEQFNIRCAAEYFRHEYLQMEDRLRGGVRQTATVFVNLLREYRANKVFCPPKDKITIKSMESVVDSGKLFLFDINQPGLSRAMGTFIKLLYQQAVLSRLKSPERMVNAPPCIIAIDEYQDVVTCGGGGTLGDESFGAKAREAKAIPMVATQSLVTLMNAIGNPEAAGELIQTYRTRIACHSSDIKTISHYKELFGQIEKDSSSKSISELSQKAKPNYLLGGFESNDANLTESISVSKRLEYEVTGREFSRLRTFEAYAQVFDGVETRHIKLFLKPYFLKEPNTAHENVLQLLAGGETEKEAPWLKRMMNYNFSLVRKVFRASSGNGRATAAMIALVSGLLLPLKSSAVPNVCSVASSPEFRSCLELSIGGCTCGFPPHPCALISYYVPQTFIEVHPEPGSSYFSSFPGTAAQLSTVGLKLPYGAEGDADTQSFHAHTIAVPLTSVLFQTMPSGGTRTEKLCFDGMSEHLGTNWTTGQADLKQPNFIAWSLAPKACLLKGALTSASGGNPTAPSPEGLACSTKLMDFPFYPPSTYPACTGWGVFYPRSGVYSGPASMTGALMIASRIKSLSAEVFKSTPNSPDEKWQMILPQSSSCFREGQNVGLLETVKNARETQRLLNGKLKGYLFVIWSKTTSCKEMPQAAQAEVIANGLPALCKGLQ